MNLNQWAAETKKSVFDRLLAGFEPGIGEFDPETLKEARTKDRPQMGATVFEPTHVRFEFIYRDPVSSSLVLTVRIPAPERIVFMSVPAWVVENVWQGDVDGTYRFESEAKGLLDEFSASLEPESNRTLFGPRPATRRE